MQLAHCHTAWLKTSHPTCLYARVIPSSCHPRCVFDRPFVVCLFVFVLLLILSVVYLFSSTLFLHSAQHFISNVNSAEGNNRCATAERVVLPHGDIPSSHRCPTSSEKRYLHHCSFRSVKNQRIEDKLVTLMKKVCCHLSPFSHTQERGDTNTNQVRLKNGSQVAKWKTKELGFSLKDRKSKSSKLVWHTNRRCLGERVRDVPSCCGQLGLKLLLEANNPPLRCFPAHPYHVFFLSGGGPPKLNSRAVFEKE